MAMILNHTIVPARTKSEAARWFADNFDLSAESTAEVHFASVSVNGTLKLLFADAEEFEPHHYAFCVSDAEFDSILGRVKESGIDFGSAPGPGRMGS